MLGAYSTRDFKPIDPTGFYITPGRGVEIPKVQGSWALGSIADQKLWMDTADGVVTLSLINWNLPAAADFDAWDFRGLACRLIVHIGPILLNVTTPAAPLNNAAATTSNRQRDCTTNGSKTLNSDACAPRNL